MGGHPDYLQPNIPRPPSATRHLFLGEKILGAGSPGPPPGQISRGSNHARATSTKLTRLSCMCTNRTSGSTCFPSKTQQRSAAPEARAYGSMVNRKGPSGKHVLTEQGLGRACRGATKSIDSRAYRCQVVGILGGPGSTCFPAPAAKPYNTRKHMLPGLSLGII